jgi:uncharacterized protein
MIIDLSSILKDIGGAIDVCGKAELEDTDFLGEEFVFPDGLTINGKITNNTKSLHLTADVSGKVKVHCARCMEEIEEPVSFKISEFLVSEEQATDSDDDDAVVFSDDKIDIDELIINNFLLNSSGKYLCSEDCKGLCPSCGKNLNHGECNCSDDSIDPRWAALAEIIKNSKTE